MSGWFAVKRGITSHPLFNGKPERLAVWMWLLDNAVWKETTHDVKGHTVDVPRGSVCASSRYIADQVGVGHQVARTALKRFQTAQMVNTTPTHGKNVITLCNYEKYQDPKVAANTTPNTSLTQRQHVPNTQKEQGNKETRKQRTSDEVLVTALAEIVGPDISKAFVAHRKELKKPLTVNAINAMAKKLEGHHDPGAVLTDSIANGWQGIFPDKVRNTTNQLKAINGGQYDQSSHIYTQGM